MDPITTAILAAISAGAVSGATKVGEKAIVDTYAKLKELLKKKFGSNSHIIKAVKDLETQPNSTARKEVVKEEITAARANQDKEILKTAEALLKIIKAKPDGAQLIQNAIGNQNIQVAGDSNTIDVNIPKPKK